MVQAASVTATNCKLLQAEVSDVAALQLAFSDP
jgi:hypothetical protein